MAHRDVRACVLTVDQGGAERPPYPARITNHESRFMILDISQTTGPTVKRHKSKQDYPTPWELIHACDARFGAISFDLAATDENKKAAEFFSPTQDSLTRSWHKIMVPSTDRPILWLNPPFSDIAPWAKKCAEESKLGARILFLTPASVGSNWFRDHVHGQAHVLALNGRITFIGAEDPYPKDCIISAFGFGKIGFDVWKWA